MAPVNFLAQITSRQLVPHDLLRYQPLIYPILMLVIGWPVLAIQTKRWHDVNKSAWWILVNAAPVLGPLVTLVYCGFLPGTLGSNRFGAQPVSPASDQKSDQSTA
jgi:uncharacterized membrane protein YhaH (DUF805 family)